MLLDKTIRLFLDSIGRREEYEFYLERFQAGDTPAFALIYPDADCVEQAADVLLFDLQFLIQLGLAPVVLLPACLAESAFEAHAGEVRRMSLDAGTAVREVAGFVQSAISGHGVPVLSSAAPVPDMLRLLVPAIGNRVHIVRACGAMRSGAHAQIYYYYTQRPNTDVLRAEDESTFALARDLLEARPGVHISITSPMNLLREVFTVKGAGTVIRRGSVIHAVGALEGIDREQLLALLDRAFGKSLSDTSFLSAVRHGYIEEEYRGAALLESRPFGDYLSKFAVGTEARGQGLALELWDEVVAHHPRLFWRCRDQNPIRSWYEKQADGRQRIDAWLVFWRGIEPEHVPALVAYCRDRSPDFDESSGT